MMKRVVLLWVVLATACYGQYLHRTFTPAELPPTGHRGAVLIVEQALGTDSCTVGGGTKRFVCVDTGEAWVPFDSPAGGSASWGSIGGTLSAQTDLGTALSGKAASSHGHAQSEVTDLVTALSGKAASSHAHPISDVTALQTALDGKSATGHGHAIADTTGLQTALDGKSVTGHGHAIADTTGLQTALDGKSASGHGHAISDTTGLQTALDGKQASLSFPLALTQGGTNQATWTGSRCVQVNSGGTALESAAGACGSGGGAWGSITGTLSNQTDLQNALNAKQDSLGFTAVPDSRTVAGHSLTGNVTVSASDVGLGNVNNTSDLNKPISTATQTALDTKQANLGFTPENVANKNAASGYAGLGADTKVAAAQLPNPAAGTLGGLKSLTCSGTDKLSAIGTDGLPVCTADQSTTLGSTWRQMPWLYTDCLAPTGVAAFTPFYGVAVASGTINAPNASIVTTHHPGVVKAKSSTTTNSGYLIGSTATMFLLGGGEAFEAVFNITTLTTSTFRFGFHDSVTSADAVDGVYLEILATGVATGKTSNNSTRSSTGTTYTVSTGTWYRLLITVTSTSRVDYYLYNDAGTQLWTNNLTTNIPSAAGRETGAAVIGTNSATTATDSYHLDWLAVYFTTVRTR